MFPRSAFGRSGCSSTLRLERLRTSVRLPFRFVMYNQIKVIEIEVERKSASLLQQRMHIGYNHASRMIDLLERRGVIGPHRGAGPREIIAS